MEASWALTGENAAYKGLIPATSFSPSKGTWGAFEVAARFGEIDFDDDLFPTSRTPTCPRRRPTATRWASTGT